MDHTWMKFQSDRAALLPRCRVNWFAGIRPGLFIYDPDLIKTVTDQVTSKVSFLQGGYTLIKPWLGKNLNEKKHTFQLKDMFFFCSILCIYIGTWLLGTFNVQGKNVPNRQVIPNRQFEYIFVFFKLM